jgi:hypothetical protein
VLGALFGRRVATSGSVGRATTAMRGAGRVAREKDDVKRAREDLKVLEQQLQDLQLEFESQVEKLHARVDPDRMVVERFRLRPRKGDMTVQTVGLLWTPWRLNAGNTIEPL